MLKVLKLRISDHWVKWVLKQYLGDYIKWLPLKQLYLLCLLKELTRHWFIYFQPPFTRMQTLSTRTLSVLFHCLGSAWHMIGFQYVLCEWAKSRNLPHNFQMIEVALCLDKYFRGLTFEFFYFLLNSMGPGFFLGIFLGRPSRYFRDVVLCVHLF